MIFCMSGGGSGSSYLISNLRRKMRVMARPDVCLEPGGKGGVPEGTTWNGGLSKAAMKVFFKRTGMRLGPNATLEQLFEMLVKTTDYAIVFGGNICQLGDACDWTEWRAPMFVVRHPLHQYVSWYEHQHPEMQVGSLDSEASVARFANYWCNVCHSAYGRTTIRYEYAREDAERNHVAKWIFKGFNSDKRNSGVLSKKAEGWLRDGTEGAYRRLYDTWEI